MFLAHCVLRKTDLIVSLLWIEGDYVRDEG